MAVSGYFIVIHAAGCEPMAVQANVAGDVRKALGDVALCAKTTRAALLRAGWAEKDILVIDGGGQVVLAACDEEADDMAEVA